MGVKYAGSSKPEQNSNLFRPKKVVDAKDGFSQEKLDFESSYKTTFKTPFGRYRWLCMPFGISYAPVEWQRTCTNWSSGFKVWKSLLMTLSSLVSATPLKKLTRALNVAKEHSSQDAGEWNFKLNKDKVKRAQTNM